MPLRVQRLEREDRLDHRVLEGSGLSGVRASEPDEVSWESERFSDLAQATLGAVIAGDGQLHPDFRGHSPMPAELETTWEGASGAKLLTPTGGEVRELDGASFNRELAGLRREFSNGSTIKMIGVEIGNGQVRTQSLVEFRGEQKQARMRWDCIWEQAAGASPKLLALRRQGYREVRRAGNPMFVDAAGTVLGDTQHFAALVGRGIADWAREITRFGDLALTGHHGIAVGDVDGDGREDVFVCDAGSLPNRLYRQLPDGTAEDVSERAGVDWYEDTRSALLVDLDNDGDPDLVAATIAMIAFAENDGTGKFTLRGGFPGAQYPFSISATDYDLDGDLDLYACIYGEGDSASGDRGFDAHAPIPFEDAQNGGRNVLLENLGDFGFANVTAETGLDANNTRWSFAAAWEDFDRDGDPDLYVANDFGKNCLYRNDGGGKGRRPQFVEIAGEFGTDDIAAGMSVSWGDYNRDGKADIYVGNMFSAAGSRVSRQGGFAPERGGEAVAKLQRMAQGNSLFAGSGKGFEEIAEGAGAAMGKWAWSSAFVDVDNDGWEDVVVANGYITGWSGEGDL